MRYLGSIVRVSVCVMGDPGHDFSMCYTVASQLVGHETKRFVSLTLQELPKESSGRTPVPTGLDEDINHVVVRIHGAPMILSFTVDRDEDFVQERGIAEAILPSSQLPRVVWTEFPAPLPHRFIRHDDSSFGKQILDLPEAQTELIIEPHGEADDFWRKTVPEIARSAVFDTAIVPRRALT